MKADSWPGLVTNASPFAIPLGAAVEQTNLESRVPGQLTTRGGMRTIATLGAAPEIVDCYPYAAGGKTYLIGMTREGSLVALESPAYGPAIGQPVDPALASESGTTQTSYTYRYATATSAAAPPVVEPPTSLIGSLDGGVADQVPQYVVDAMLSCSQAGAVTDVDGGSSSGDAPAPSVLPAELCPL